MPGNERGQAVVLGASMAGLLAARALSDHFASVTVIDRDELTLAPDYRRGVPQARHAHGLLASGYRVIDEYFPGLMAELVAAGAPRGDVVGDFLWFQYGCWKLRHDSGLGGILVSRPRLEASVRAHVQRLPNVTLAGGREVVEPVYDAARGSVTGVRVRARDAGEDAVLPANLVIDASGRGSQTPKWLASWGFARPPETTVRVDVGYATRTFVRKPGDFRDSMGGIIAGTPPESTRFAAVLAAEGDRWVITLAGTLGDYPPADEPAWLDWARSLPVPDVFELARANEALTDIATYRFSANQRRHFEQMQRFPSGYLAVGDAVCSFNPIYGQGMSAAALEARALGDALQAGDDQLARRFFRAAARIADIPWVIATGEDFRYPQVEGKRPPGYRLVSRYLERLHHVAAVDPVVCGRFFEVANLLAPPTAVLAPRVARRVLFRRLPSRATSA